VHDVQQAHGVQDDSGEDVLLVYCLLALLQAVGELLSGA